MNWLHRIIAMVMLAVWMPAASLCLAECAGFIGRDDCCPDESTGHADAAHPCCLLASGNYKSDTEVPLVVAPVSFATEPASSMFLEVPPSAESVPPSPSPSPPDLPVPWQFSFRAALPPRAPSPTS